ncbi:MAG: hypothetical protein A3H96_11460 [Acidobacteria bacterium RIFCSPLOWO2_02_FULL_67_36]|nr:MAG: hypothetical protein A3H96_11460 [Acidobacteria bacterium RIFCSPLOWO2_02_FULL_67_36]OGA76290.1 MAG: hypothetical protein A3G27_05755 [Betaproteobacteria bacterium RIFCSPLOWO2_12_FULL_66_14]
MVFVNSMSDLFHEDVPDEFIDRVFAVMALCPQHVFQILTKRVGRMRAYKDLFTGVDDRVEQAADWIREQIGVNAPKGYEVDSRFQRAAAALAAFSWPLPNVWLGVSVENQHFADERIPLLLQTPAAVRFVSAEPLLGALNIEPFLWDEDDRHDALCGLDLVIVGGESGPKARPLWVPWVRSIKDQCEAAGVSCFVKQLGADVRDRNDAGFTGDFDGSGTCWPEQHEIDDRIESDLDGTRDDYQGAPVRIHLRDRKGGDPSEWPEDLRVRQFPGARG